MKVLSSLILAASINAIGIASASAAVVFEDDFESYSEAIPAASSFGGWNVISGSVDVIGAGTSYDWFSGAYGKYLDLDGSTGTGGYLSTNAIFGSGSYLIEFDLAGSQRGDSNEVIVTFGTDTWVFNLNGSDPFQSFTQTVTFNSPTNTALAFKNSGGDNIGALLDNVRVTAVPEPGSYAMMFAGMMMIGSVVIRKSKHSA